MTSLRIVSISDFESLDEDTQVVATARGKFTSQGGVLSSPESGVSIVIPEGAIPTGVEQEIYFKVCKDNNFMPPLDSDRGEDFKVYVDCFFKHYVFFCSFFCSSAQSYLQPEILEKRIKAFFLS